MKKSEIIILDHNADKKTHGLDAWQGITWDYPENVRNTQELAKPEPLKKETFLREFSLLMEHTNRKEPSTPLLQKYFGIISAKLTEQRFLSACEAVYTQEKLYSSDLIAFLCNYHVNERVTNAAAYQTPAILEQAATVDIITPEQRRQGTNAQRNKLYAQAREVL
jgi:hypothetical protein